MSFKIENIKDMVKVNQDYMLEGVPDDLILDALFNSMVYGAISEYNKQLIHAIAVRFGSTDNNLPSKIQCIMNDIMDDMESKLNKLTNDLGRNIT